MNAEKQDKETYGTELVKMERIEETPFTLVTIEDKGSFIAIGEKRVSDFKESKEELIELINGKSWELIVATIGVINGMYNEIKEN